MLFSSIPFLYYFFPAVLIIYFAVPRAFKNAVLLLASLIFYGWGEPVYLLLMTATIALFYICGLLIGSILTSLMMLLSLFFTKDGMGYSTGISCLLHAGIPLLSVIGSYLGLQKRSPKRHRK